MKNSLLALFIGLVGSIAPLAVQASVEVQAQHLTTSQGLSNNSIRHIFQDSKGFIWMSTLNGLNRYDGNSFVNFRPRSDVDIYLADHRGKTLFEDNNGYLWISTAADLFSCYDLRKDCFVDFTGCGEYLFHYRHLILLGDDIWLWGISDGCRKITYKDGKFSSEVFNMDTQHLSSDDVRFVSPGDDGKIWVGTTEGLYYYENGKMKCVNDTHFFQRTCHSQGKDFFVSSEGIVWVYEPQKGLSEIACIPQVLSAQDLPGELLLDKEWIVFTSTGAYSLHTETHVLAPAPPALNVPKGEVLKDNRNNYWVFNKTGNLIYVNTKSGAVKKFQLMPEEKIGFIDMERYHIIHDSRDIIWITTYGNGLFAYDLKNDELQHIVAGSGKSDLIRSNFLLAVMEDRAGNIWASSEFTGVSCLKVINEGAHRINPGNKGSQKDHSNTVRLISSMDDGNIWIGTRDGKIVVYDSKLTTQKEVMHYDANIYAVCEDTIGQIWKGSRGKGVYVGNKKYTYNVKDPTSLSSNEIFSLLRDSKGRIWVGTFGGGLNLAVPDEEKGYKFKHFFNKTYGQRRIRALCEDNKGWIWVGTSDGVIIFNPEKLLKDPEDYHQYNWNNKSLLSDEIRSVKQDSKGNFWIAETGTGFSVCTPGEEYGNLRFTHYGVQNGLVSSMVLGFVEDKNGLMWITTEYGVSCFDPAHETFQNYFFSSDMLSNVYSESSALRLQDGRLIMGTNHGLVVVDPLEAVDVFQEAPTVTFTNLKLNGVTVRPGDPGSPIDQSLAYMEAIHLHHFQHSFIIDFSTLDYSEPESTKYSYKLEGYDKEWSEPSTTYFAAYKNLTPGTYHLYVKACNAAGRWGKEDAVIKVVIAPPFWQTTWAFLIYALLLAVALYIAYRVVRNMNELQYKIRMEKQLTEYKLMFFTNISHEFRTPLTLIQGALERMRRVGKIPKEMVYSVKMMDKSTQRMLRLINQLLEFRKMQNNKLALSLEETDVIAFLREIHGSFKEAAESKNMKFGYKPAVASYKMFIDQGKLDKVIYNLLSNAFKYTPSGGRVNLEVTLDEDAQMIVMKVSDSGVGIPTEKREQLFKRFMQSRFSGGSVGVGLHLTYELVNVHQGTIEYNENPGGGSIFTVKLSTDSSVYKEDDFLIPDNVLLQEEHILKNRLPALHAEEPAEESTVAAEDEQPAELPLNKRKILIIEDDNDVRDFLKEELCAYFEVAAEANGESGLQYASAEEVDLIVCDVMMPGCSGFEVTKRLKEDFTTSHIPIILLTALTDPESHLEGVESGADAYITKPFSPKLLLARIFKLIEQRDKLREKFSNDLSVVRPAICTTNKDKEFMEKMTRIMEEQLENPDFTVNDFASMMALGRTIFYRKVRGVTGYSPKEYIRIMRMKKAAELLQTTRYTVSEVTYKVGINDPSYFSKCFKDQFGMAPSVYLKNAEANLQEEQS